jgi:hypothetical protein
MRALRATHGVAMLTWRTGVIHQEERRKALRRVNFAANGPIARALYSTMMRGWA